MDVCDELYEAFEKLGCIPKGGTALRNARGPLAGVSGKTQKKCVEEWEAQGKVEPCNECSCNGIRTTPQNNPHPKSKITEALTSLEETWRLPPVGSEISERLDVAQTLLN